MAHRSYEGALRSSLAVTLTALVALAAAAPAAAAPDGTASYEYKVVGVDYDATANLAAGRDSGSCSPNYTAGWFGEVATFPDDADVAGLTSGSGGLTIGRHGTTGRIKARMAARSTFSNAHHIISKVCDDLSTTTVDEQEDVVTPCSDSAGIVSTMKVLATIDGGVGDRVDLTWVFRHGGAPPSFVSRLFTCVEAFEWPAGPQPCTSTATLNTFTSKTVKLPFTCMNQSSFPPSGVSATYYSASSFADGSLKLKRTKER